MAFDLCVIPVSTVPYLSALQTRQLSMTEITAHLVSEKLTCEQCRSMTSDTFSSSYGSSSHALHVRSSVSYEINLSLTSSASASNNAPTGYTIVIQGYLNDQNSPIVLGVCVSDEPIVADASLRLFVNIEETKNVFRLSADFDGMVTQGLLDDILDRYVTTDTKQTITSTKTLRSGAFRTNLNISDIAVEYVPSSTSGHISTATLASDGIRADGVSFKNAYGRAADNYLVASVSGNGGYSEITGLGGRGFDFCYKGADETDYHYPLRIDAGITMFDENQTLHLAKDTNTYLHVDDDTLSVKDYVERVAGSGSPKFVVADVNTSDPTKIGNLTEYRPSDESSDNPHYNSNKASFKFDVSELPSNGMTFEVFMPLTSFVGSVQLVCGSSNYIYPIYFRGDDNVHCPTVPQGSVLRITFHNNAFYGDFYDLADFGDEHEAYVYVGKVPVDKSSSDLSKFSGLVGIDRDTGKFSQLFTVSVTDNGSHVEFPRLRENSPIYACFQGDCFAAHPKVPFGNILRITDDFYTDETLQIHMLPFTYYPFDDGDTVEAHIVVNTSSLSDNKYFQVDDCPVYIQAESNSVLIGNPPADIHARLIGFMCSGAENAGMIRLVENDAVFYVSDDDYSKIFAGVWDYNTVDSNTQTLSGEPLSYDSDNVLVVFSKSSSKLVPLLVHGPCGGDIMVNTQFDWESPIYALFKGFRCFSAHPMVNFIQIIGSNSMANSPVFISDYGEMYETDKRFCVGIPSDVNIPSSDIHWRLLGYTTSTPGYIRLTESHPFLKDFIHQTGGYVKLSDFTDTFYDYDYGRNFNPSQFVEYLQTEYGYDLSYAVEELVLRYGSTVFHLNDLDISPSSVRAAEIDGEVYVSLPSMTTVEFEDRMSFRTSAGEAAYIDSDGVYHGDATGISSTPKLSFNPATSVLVGGLLNVTVGGKTSPPIDISPVKRAYEAVSAETATTLETSRTIDGMLFDGSSDIRHYGTCSTSSATVAKVVTLPGFTLVTGARIAVKFTYSNTASSPTLNVNGTGAQTIRRYGSYNVDTSKYLSWLAGSIVEFVYDGSSWIWVGFQYNTYQASQAESADTATRARYLSDGSNDIACAYYGTATTRYLRPYVNATDTAYIDLGASNYRWNRLFARYLGNSSYPITSAYIDTIYGLDEQLYGSGVGSLYLIYFKAVTNSTSSYYTSYSRGSLLQSGTTCTISDVADVTVYNTSGQTSSTPSSYGQCLTMYTGSTISSGANGVFRLLNRISLPSSSTRYFLALVVRVA